MLDATLDALTNPRLVVEMLSDPDLDPDVRQQLQAFHQAANAARASGADAILITVVGDDGPEDVLVPV